MTTNNYLLTFELSRDADELDVHCDDIGLDKLLSILSKLKGKIDHEHLMTPKWGGCELSEGAQSDGGQILNKVTIHKW